MGDRDPSLLLQLRAGRPGHHPPLRHGASRLLDHGPHAQGGVLHPEQLEGAAVPLLRPLRAARAGDRRAERPEHLHQPGSRQAAGGKANNPEGRSLMPLLGSSHPVWRNHFLVEHSGGVIPAYCAIRSKHDLYVSYRTGEQELYNLRQDPYELRNVAYDPKYASLRRFMNGEKNHMCWPRPPGYTVRPAPAGGGG